MSGVLITILKGIIESYDINFEVIIKLTIYTCIYRLSYGNPNAEQCYDDICWGQYRCWPTYVEILSCLTAAEACLPNSK